MKNYKVVPLLWLAFTAISCSKGLGAHAAESSNRNSTHAGHHLGVDLPDESTMTLENYNDWNLPFAFTFDI